MAGRLIIVANRLPITVSETPQGLTYQPSPGGLAASLGPALRKLPVVWIGYGGLNRQPEADELARLKLPPQLRPVAIPAERYRRYYYRYANGAMWPTFHGFVPRQMFDEADWRATMTVMQQFADAVEAVMQPGDRIWVHDFHLMMLPRVLRDRGVRNPIGYFSHVPWARPERFAALPHYAQLLDSLAEVDVLGVQTPRDLVQLERVLRELGGDLGLAERARAFPVGIDYEAYRAAAHLPVVQQRRQALEPELAGKTVVFSMSRLDYTKGILEQLAGVEALLAAAPDPGAIVYHLVAAPSREDLREYRELKAAIAARVAAINARFSSRPVRYEYRSLPFEELCAWYCRADVMLVAPVLDGMNLIAKEYIATRPDDAGVLVLSRFAGAAVQMTQALLVDPSRPQEVAAALQQAMAMPADERRTRHQALRRGVKAESALHWAQSFDKALQGARYHVPD